jgi:SSS family solute:Na+ symporter
MTLLGLHPVDWIVILLYVVAMVVIALWARRRARGTSGFYQGDRSFGKTLMAFLNFGSITDAGQTTSAMSEIFRQGLQGVWVANVVLFHTPFQWFIASLQRRARYLAPGDTYQHRFESRFLSGLYAVVLLAVAIYSNAFLYMITGKTLQAIMVKPAAEYTIEERASVNGFQELTALKKIDPVTITPEQKARRGTLEEMQKRGEIASFASYLNLTTFYIVYAVLVTLYTIIGGLFAVAIIDVIQGVLIVFLSIALIPAALSAIGGIAGLQAKVPERMFEIFGSSAASDYTWYFVAGLSFLNLVVNAPKSFMIGGSARDDMSARIGFVSGSVFKRFMMIAWAFTGLLAIGLYGGRLSDPTNVWGYMTSDLLGAGIIGLMIAAVFSANMDGSSTSSLEVSAAITKNIYQPLVPRASERSQMILGRAIVASILGLAALFAGRLTNVLDVFKYVLSVGTIVGPSFWLVYFWRRLNTRAVAAQMLISIFLTVVAPYAVGSINSLATNPTLTARTDERMVSSAISAGKEDVQAGRAARVGQTITKQERVPPAAIFFDEVVRSVPADSTSPMVGKGLFHPQIWILSRLGFDFRSWPKAAIATAGFLFDAIVPFILLIAFSLVTRPNSEEVLRDFYARVHTPAVADPDLDARLVREKIENPARVERDKIFPGTSWEFWKPTRVDIVGFVACVGFVLLIIFLYRLVASIGVH